MTKIREKTRRDKIFNGSLNSVLRSIPRNRAMTISEIREHLLNSGVSATSLKPHKLTADEWREINRDPYLLDWWLQVPENAACVDAVLAEIEEQKKTPGRARASKAMRLWEAASRGDAEAATEQTKEYQQEQAEWARAHPQFIQNEGNAREIFTTLAERRLLPSADNIDQIYQELVLAGRLEISLEALGISGYPFNVIDDYRQVQRLGAEDLRQILEPYTVRELDREAKRVAKQTADQF